MGHWQSSLKVLPQREDDEDPVFITFEGIDGAGKSTQITRLQTRLEATGQHVLWTREPGGTPIGDVIRELLLSAESESMVAKSEALLYAASRAQLVGEVIRPALEQGQIVVCDRFVDASIAYQGAGLGIGIELVREVNHFATGGLTPDLTFLFDLPVEESKVRVRKTRGAAAVDRIEQRDDEYFSTVRQAFLDIAAAQPERVKVLNALSSPDELEQEIWQSVSNLLSVKGW